MGNRIFKIGIESSGINNNATPIVRCAIDELRDGGTISFETGEYHFYEEGTLEGFFAVSNNTSGIKKVAFPIIGCKDITVDGNGSVFVFHGKAFPFIVQKSSGVSLKNIIITRMAPPNTTFTVHEQTDEGFYLDVDENTSWEVRGGEVYFKSEISEFSTLKKHISLHRISPFCVRFLFVGDCEYPREGLPAPSIYVEPEERDGRLYLRYRKDTPWKEEYNEGEDLLALLVSGGTRELCVILLDSSEDILIKDVAIRRGFGMGVIAELARNVEIDGLSVSGDFYNEPSSTTADAMHFVNCSGRVEIHNCTVRGALDDALNVHGVYTELESVTDGGIYAELKHYDQMFFNPYEKGDELHIINPETREITSTFVVEESELVDKEKGSKLLIKGSFTGGPRENLEKFLIEIPAKMPDLHVHHNDFSDYPRMRISGGGNMLIEKNRLKNCCSALLAVDLSAYWFESGRIKNLIFRENILENCNFMGGDDFIIEVAVAGIDHEKAPKIHEYIEISGNTVNRVDHLFIRAGGVKNLVVRDNILPDGAKSEIY